MLANRSQAYQALPQILCGDIKFEENLWKDDLNNLDRFLKHPNHRIASLNLAFKLFKQSEINKVIQILSHPEIDNSKIDVINFGQRKFYEKDLIFIGKWILDKFSTRVEENTFDIRKYLFSMSKVDSTDETAINKTSRDMAIKLKESSNSRERRGIHFRLDYVTNDIVETSK